MIRPRDEIHPTDILANKLLEFEGRVVNADLFDAFTGIIKEAYDAGRKDASTISDHGCFEWFSTDKYRNVERIMIQLYADKIGVGGVQDIVKHAFDEGAETVREYFVTRGIVR